MIQIKDLEKRFGSFRLALSFSLPAGHVTGLIGRSGAGKSALLDCIAGLLQADAGEILVFGKEVSRLTDKDRLRMVLSRQDAFPSSSLSAEEWGGLQKILFPTFDGEAFLNGCRDLAVPADVPLRRLSEKVRRAVGFLGAFCRPADLYLLDEPTAGLDAGAREYLLDKLRTVLAENEGASVLIASQLSSDLEGLCDDLILLEDGQIRLQLECDELRQSWGVIRVEKERFPQLDPARLIACREEGGICSCLTNDRAWFAEHFPDLVLEAGSIDALLLLKEKP